MSANTSPGNAMSAPGPKCSMKVQRTRQRKGGQCVTGTPKSAMSARTVPLPGWLAERTVDYLDYTHPRADEPSAPLWPNRALGGLRRRARLTVAPLDFSEPVDTGAFYKNVVRPALEAVGLPASRPAHTRDDGTSVAKVEGVRLHDLRHTFATLQLSAGVHFMQVSKWLGHSTFTLTTDVYGDYIPEQDGAAAK
jgi:integrase